MALLDTKQNVLLFKYGGTPTADDVVNINDVVLVSPDIKQQDFKELDGEMGNTQSYIDEEHTTAQLSIKAKMRGNNKAGDALGTPPAIKDLLLSSGLTQEVQNDGDNDTGVKYYPNQGNLQPSEAFVYVDGRKRVIDGIVSDFKLSGTVGEVVIAEFTSSGYTDVLFVNETNPTVTLDSESLMIVNKVSAITVGSAVLNLKSFDFSLNNDIQDIYAINLAKYERVDFDPKISLTAYEDSASTAWDDLATQSIKSIVITLGNGAGKTVTLTIGSAKPLTNSESDDSGKLGITREFRCLKDGTSGHHFELLYS